MQVLRLVQQHFINQAHLPRLTFSNILIFPCECLVCSTHGDQKRACAGVRDGCDLWCGWWEPNPGPLKTTAEPFLQSPALDFNTLGLQMLSLRASALQTMTTLLLKKSLLSQWPGKYSLRYSKTIIIVSPPHSDISIHVSVRIASAPYFLTLISDLSLYWRASHCIAL